MEKPPAVRGQHRTSYKSRNHLSPNQPSPYNLDFDRAYCYCSFLPLREDAAGDPVIITLERQVLLLKFHPALLYVFRQHLDTGGKGELGVGLEHAYCDFYPA